VTSSAPSADPDPRSTPGLRAAPDLLTALDLLTTVPTELVAGLAVTRVGREAGTAPTVLLVHGLGSARSVWAPVLPELIRRYDVVAVDLPGHGASQPLRPGGQRMTTVATHLARTCAELGVARPHVVGNSLGGWAGFELAADGKAASLTALAPAGLRIRPGRPRPVLWLNRRLAELTGPAVVPLLGVRAVRGLVFASATVDPLHLDPALARASALAVQQASGYWAMLEIIGHARFERAADVGVPVTVVIGEADRILPGKVHRSRRMAPPHTRWVSLPACGHAPMWDAPQRTVQLIDETVAAAGTPLHAR
jgi:pimeloyl-ACP methyl ester carboxylesterase